MLRFAAAAENTDIRCDTMRLGYDTITVVQCTVRHDTMRCSETALRYDIMMVRYDMVRLSYEYDTIQYDTIQCDANDTI